MTHQPDRPHAGTLVIFNPAAGHGAAGVEQELSRAVTTRTGWRLAVTTGPGHAIELAAATECGVVVAAGGDGTVNEVVNGLMLRAPRDRPLLGIIPVGSGDDYAVMLRLPRSVPDAIRVIETSHPRSLDVGLCNGRWFVNSVSVGLDARVTARVAAMKGATGLTGLPLYLRALMHTLLRDYRVHDIRIAIDDDASTEATVTLVAVGIGPTYGGGFRILPEARPDDGLLDVVAIDGVSLPSALWRLPFVVTGHHLRMRPVHLVRAHRIVIESASPLAGQMDGEVISSDRYDISLRHGGLDVLAG